MSMVTIPLELTRALTTKVTPVLTLEILFANSPVRGRRPRRPAPLCMMLAQWFQPRDEGVPRGPGGPPHSLCRIRSFGKNEWHWVNNLPHETSSRCISPKRLSTRELLVDRKSVAEGNI